MVSLGWCIHGTRGEGDGDADYHPLVVSGGDDVGEDNEMFMTRNRDVTTKTTEQRI